MYLSRLTLNPRSRAVRRDLADCQALHRTILAAFPDVADGGASDARGQLGILHRVDLEPRSGQAVLLVQSASAPDWSHLPDDYLADSRGALPNPATKAVAEQYAAIQDGQELVFRLRANPSKKIDTKTGADGQRRNGRRVPLRSEAEQLAWLARKGEAGGFRLLHAAAEVPDVRRGEEADLHGFRRDGAMEGKAARLTFGAVVFEGRLWVANAEQLRETLRTGIGSAKAYGFGLLSVAPVVRGA